MNKVRTPFNTTSVAQAAALAALGDVEHIRRSVESNRAGMMQLARGLERLETKFVPSFGNFLYVEAGSRAADVARGLEKMGVIVRLLDWMGMPDGLRVTVGTAEENTRFPQGLWRHVSSVAFFCKSDEIVWAMNLDPVRHPTLSNTDGQNTRTACFLEGDRRCRAFIEALPAQLQRHAIHAKRGLRNYPRQPQRNRSAWREGVSEPRRNTKRHSN